MRVSMDLIRCDDNILRRSVELRHELHQHPSLSSQEDLTKARLLKHLQHLIDSNANASGFKCDLVQFEQTSGFAIVLTANNAGQSTLFRCELDALPIEEAADHVAHASQVHGVSHRCGHDGHMAIIFATLAHVLQQPSTYLAQGKAIFLFQPAEETGHGAQQLVSETSVFERLCPDMTFALHNVPGLASESVFCKHATFSCASRGMRVELNGSHAHAAHPEDGVSPAIVLAQLTQKLASYTRQSDYLEMITVTYAQLGAEPNYGIAPGAACLQATLRTERDEDMARLVVFCEKTVHECGVCVAAL